MNTEKRRNWHIRGMPADVIEEINAAAKGDRMTVAEWLATKLRPILDEQPSVTDYGERIAALERGLNDLGARMDARSAAAQSTLALDEGGGTGGSIEETRARWEQRRQGRR